MRVPSIILKIYNTRLIGRRKIQFMNSLLPECRMYYMKYNIKFRVYNIGPCNYYFKRSFFAWNGASQGSSFI